MLHKTFDCHARRAHPLADMNNCGRQGGTDRLDFLLPDTADNHPTAPFEQTAHRCHELILALARGEDDLRDARALFSAEVEP